MVLGNVISCNISYLKHTLLQSVTYYVSIASCGILNPTQHVPIRSSGKLLRAQLFEKQDETCERIQITGEGTVSFNV